MGEEFPDVTVDYLHVDAAMIFLTTDPARFDVIVTDNLFGDIVTDLAAAVTGGIGLAASGNINPDRTAPVDVRAGPRLRPRHRRPAEGRPDRGDPVRRADARPPRLPEAAARIETAVLADLAELTGAAPRRTSEIGDAVAARVTADPPTRRTRRQAGPSSTDPPTKYGAPMSALDISVTPNPTPTSDDRVAEILADPGFGMSFTDHMVTSSGPPSRAGTTRGSRRTARSASTRRPRCCTTRRRSSRA